MREDTSRLERPKEVRRDLAIGTDKTYTRGTVVRFDDETVHIELTYPVEFKGRHIEIRRSSLKFGEPFEFRDPGNAAESVWQKSGPLRQFVNWNSGISISSQDLVDKTEHRRLSADLPQNPYTLPEGTVVTSEKAREDEEAYAVSGVEPYYWHDEPHQYAVANSKDAKTNAVLTRRDTGWKVHLNVTPPHVQAVSDYLKTNHYNHKYLSGGEPNDGKVFTIYFGAKGTMDRWAGQLSADIEKYLSYPGAHDEAEVSRGVVARFTVDEKESRGGGEFTQYGAYGLSFLRGTKPPWKASREEKVADAQRTYARLQELYGSYFTG